MKIKYFLFLIFLIFFCDHSQVGKKGIAERVGKDTIIELSPKEKEKFGFFYPGCGEEGLFLGKNTYYEARVLLKFLIDTIWLNSQEIKLILYTKNFAKVKFDIYPLKLEWEEKEVTWKLAKKDLRWIFYGGDYYENLLLGSGEGEKDSLIIFLSPNHFDTVIKTNFGIILIPKETEEDLISFYPRTERRSPKIYIKKNNKEDTLYPISNAYIIDTLFEIPENYLAIGTGYNFFTYLKFDLKDIPQEANIINADLFLTGELENSYFPIDTNEIIVLKLLKEYEKEKTPYEIFKRQIVYRDSIKNGVKIDIKSLVKFWLEKPDSNFGIFINFYPFSSYPRYLLLKEPRLEIFYFKESKFRD
jgi:hypothetical protein